MQLLGTQRVLQPVCAHQSGASALSDRNGVNICFVVSSCFSFCLEWISMPDPAPSASQNRGAPSFPLGPDHSAQCQPSLQPPANSLPPPQALGTSLSQFPSLLDVSHFFQKCFYGVSCVCLHKNCCVAMVPVASREAVKLCLMVDPQWFWIKPPTFCSSL